MVLHNLFVPGREGVYDISITENRITAVTDEISDTDPLQIRFSSAMVFPGLINSHDHLDFDLFPQLGNKTYTNYKQWGPFIQEEYKSEIEKILKIPGLLRSRWGIFKNLLAGVTSVAHHGDHLEMNDLVTILQAQSIHSVRFEKWWKLRLNNFLNKRLCVIHVGEGTDGDAVTEIDELIRWNIFKRRIVAVHGVAMSTKQAKRLEALIWCPVSNYFLLNRTAEIDELKNAINICFGTDSTLTAGWNIWDHLRSARNTGLVTDAELFNMITINPASLWKTETGRLEANYNADLVIAEAEAEGWNSFYSINPENILLVMHNGKIKLCDDSVRSQLPLGFSGYNRVDVNGRIKYVEGGIKKLMEDIHHYNPEIQFPVSINEN